MSNSAPSTVSMFLASMGIKLSRPDYSIDGFNNSCWGTATIRVKNSHKTVFTIFDEL